jgi:Lon-like protease
VSRRVRTLIVSGVLFFVLFILALTLPVPYVILSPGPTYNTLGTDDSGNTIIVINGKGANATSGHLNMTTVSYTTRPLTAFAALNGWLLHDRVVVPKSSIIPPDKTQQQIDQENTQEFQQSQDSATAAAFCELGYPASFGISTVNTDSPANGILAPGDALVSLGGDSIDTIDKLTAVLSKHHPGEVVTVTVKRAGKAVSLPITLIKPVQGRSGSSIGITVTSGCLAPFSVDLGLGNQIGGPSAGLMFALGIMDKIGTRDLTKGRFIAGTGTIDPSGNVGPIGGIQLKMIAARAAGASVFLAPAGNCDDVRKATPKGLEVIKVTALHDAVQDLLALENGQPVPHC